MKINSFPHINDALQLVHYNSKKNDFDFSLLFNNFQF